MNENVPKEVMEQLPDAVKEPSIFISNFLKQKNQSETLSSIFEAIQRRFVTDDETKKEKYAMKLKAEQEHYEELTKEPLKKDFNSQDFLKTAFLQYMLYAYLIKEYI